MQLRGAWDLNNPRLLRKQPSERDLSRCRLLPFCDAAEQINQGLIRLESLRREARESAAEVGAVESRVFVDLAREEALAQRAIGNEANSEFLEGRNHFLLRGSRPQRVFALEGSERLDCVCATDRLHACFRKAEVLDLTLLDQVLHRAGDVFDRHVRVNPVLIEQVDDIDFEPLERALDSLLDVLRPTVQARSTLHPTGIEVRIEVKPELGGDHYLIAEGSEGFAHELFVYERAVNLGGVKESDAAFHRCAENRGHLLLIFWRAVRKAHAHAAEPDGRDFQVAVSKFALLHLFLLRSAVRRLTSPTRRLAVLSQGGSSPPLACRPEQDFVLKADAS